MTKQSKKNKTFDITNLTEDNLLINITENRDPVGKLLNRIIFKALQNDASEIHFQPDLDSLKIIFCQYGFCSEFINPLNKAISEALINRLKFISNIKNNNINSVVEGSFVHKIRDVNFTFWVNIIPDNYGQKIILRWWNNEENYIDFQHLIYEENTLNSINKILNKSEGLLLVTGVNNSGKSTTLYSLLNAKKQVGFKVSTVENRLKYFRDDFTQLELKNIEIFDQENYLHSLLEKKINVIFIDNFAEEEKTNLVQNLLNNNYFVLSSLNTNNFLETIDMLSAKDDTVLNSINGIINQRLLRKLCPHCRIKHKLSEAEKIRFKISEDINHYIYHSHTTDDNNCRFCQGVGYIGQIAIYEVLDWDYFLKNDVDHNLKIEEIKQFIKSKKSLELLNYGINLVLAGETTLAEIERVLPDVLSNLVIDDSEEINDENKENNPNVDLEFINDLEKNILTKFEQQLLDFKDTLNQVYEDKLTDFKINLEAKYSQKILFLEEELQSLKIKYNQLEQNFKDLSLNQKKNNFTLNLEELTDSEDWKDIEDLTKEFEEILPSNSQETKIKTETKNTVETKANFSEKNNLPEKNLDVIPNNNPVIDPW